MVDYKAKVYTEEEGNIRGVEAIIYSSEGDKIDALHITNDEDYNNLKSNLEGLDEVFVKFTNLERALDEIHVDAQTLQNLTSNDFARNEHDHGDTYSRKNHSDSENIFGIGTAIKYGHNKVINNLNSQTHKDGESLSAYQGKVLLDRIVSEINKLTKWTIQKVGNYGTLKINTQLRCCQFNYTRENYTLNGDKDLHNGYIPVAYRPSGVVRQPASKYTIISIDSEGNIKLRTTYTKTATTALIANFIWFY